jgi:26S proteasome regulatory subunit N1
LSRDLDVYEAKLPEAIYKSHLTEGRGERPAVDSARQNLASTFVNAFVNAGFCHDKLMTVDEGAWVHKNKDHGMMSAAASLGCILLWDVDEGLSQIDKYLYSNQEFVKAGALLAVGIVNSGVRNECDPALALLSDSDALDSQKPIIRIGAIVGLGLAYAGSCRDDLQEHLMPFVQDAKAPVEMWALACLSLGMVFVRSGHEEITEALVSSILERDASEAKLEDTMARFACLALGLLLLEKQEKANPVLERLKEMKGEFGEYCQLTVQTCAYAGSGNVLKVQQMLSICSDHLEEKNSHQVVAAFGIALIGMGEELGSDMAVRAFEHMLQYGETNIRRAVPLGLGLLNVSNPRVQVMDTLSKLTHDADSETAQCATFALGLIGAGTNNSRVAGLLRQLSAYYAKDQNHLFMVRIAQGMLHMGKGLMTISPMYSDRLLTSSVALAGLLVVLHAHMDVKNIILGKYHYLLYFLVTAMYPRMLVTVDEDLKPIAASVRVGQAVDIVGQAGKPKSITGFQTHTTPVVIAHGDRAELATEEYIPSTPVLEGFVILKKNPDYEEFKIGQSDEKKAVPSASIPRATAAW